MFPDYRRAAIDAAYHGEGRKSPFDPPVVATVAQEVPEPAELGTVATVVPEPATVVPEPATVVPEPATVVPEPAEPAELVVVDAPAVPPTESHAWGPSDPMRGSGPMRCRAKSKQHGGPCKKYAVPGGFVCRYHGGLSPGALRKAAQRAAIAEAVNDLSMFGGQRRHPWEVLVDVHHSADVLLQRAKAKVETGSATGADFTELVDAMDRSMKYARTVIDADLADKVAQANERQAQTITFVLNRMLSVLDLTDDEELRARAAASEALLALDDASQAQARQAIER